MKSFFFRGSPGLRCTKWHSFVLSTEEFRKRRTFPFFPRTSLHHLRLRQCDVRCDESAINRRCRVHLAKGRRWCQNAIHLKLAKNKKKKFDSPIVRWMNSHSHWAEQAQNILCGWHALASCQNQKWIDIVAQWSRVETIKLMGTCITRDVTQFLIRILILICPFCVRCVVFLFV